MHSFNSQTLNIEDIEHIERVWLGFILEDDLSHRMVNMHFPIRPLLWLCRRLGVVAMHAHMVLLLSMHPNADVPGSTSRRHDTNGIDARAIDNYNNQVNK